MSRIYKLKRMEDDPESNVPIFYLIGINDVAQAEYAYELTNSIFLM